MSATPDERASRRHRIRRSPGPSEAGAAVPAPRRSWPCTHMSALAVRSSVEVIGMQSQAAPAAYRSRQAGSLVENTTSTFAERLATRTVFELLRIARQCSGQGRAVG